MLAEAETAVRTTAATLGQASPGTGNFSLCHGDGGNADLLILAADVLVRPDLRREAENGGGPSARSVRGHAVALAMRRPGGRRIPQSPAGTCWDRIFPFAAYDFENIRSALLPAAITKKSTKARPVETKPRRSVV